MPPTPVASAVRLIVPRFWGSCRLSSIKRTASARSASAALDLGVDRLWKLDDVQDLIGVPEHRRCGCTFLGRRGPRLEPGIELADEVEQVTDGCRQVQIVAQGVIPEVENSPPTLALPPLGGGDLNIGGYPQADGAFVQALDRPFRRLQPLRREGERAAGV